MALCFEPPVLDVSLCFFFGRRNFFDRLVKFSRNFFEKFFTVGDAWHVLWERAAALARSLCFGLSKKGGRPLRFVPYEQCTNYRL